jgi:cell division protein FtsZ
MTLFEVDEAANRIREEVDNEANIVFGSTFDAEMEGLLRVSVVATGIEAEAVSSPRPMPSGLSTLTPRTVRSAPVVKEAPMPVVLPERAAGVEMPMPELEVEAEEPEALLLDDAYMTEPGEETPEVVVAPAPAPKRTVMASTRVTVTKPAQPQAAAPIGTPAPQSEPAMGKPPLTQQLSCREPFIPSKPVVAEESAEDVEPEPFAAAAMENARNDGGKSQNERRRPSLFERMTGAGKPTTKETATVSPMPNLKPAAPEVVEPKAPEADERFQLSQAEEEMLDIPAFLRRQAN